MSNGYNESLAYAMEILEGYLLRKVPIGDAVIAAASETANLYGESYFAIREAIMFLRFGIMPRQEGDYETL